MWLQNLKELKKRTGMSSKQIAEKENLPERTVARVFSGDTDNPGVDTIRRIIHALGGSWAEIFAETGAVIGGKDLATLQAEVDKLTAENALLAEQLAKLTQDYTALKEEARELAAENKLLLTEMKYKDEIIAIHNHYNRKPTNWTVR